jgi:hypothetical protein
MRSARESSSMEGASGRSRLSRDGWLGMALRVFIILRLWWHSGKFAREGRSKKDVRGFLSHISYNNFIIDPSKTPYLPLPTCPTSLASFSYLYKSVGLAQI